MWIFAFMRMSRVQRLAFVGGVVALTLLCATTLTAVPLRRSKWTVKERELLRSLTLTSLGALPADPSNRYGDDTAAARLGQRLFFDARLSQTGRVSCASCHMAERKFQDGRALGEGVGAGSRRTMPIAGTANSPWYFWDGRADSQWEQALGPLENPVEHGGDRTQYALLVVRHYRSEYESTFGPLPDLANTPAHAGPVADANAAAAWTRISPDEQDQISRVYANIGKAIAAYERRIAFAPARFDRYVDSELGGVTQARESEFTPDEEAGLRLFIGKANCIDCHNGPLFTDDHFHNTGVPTSGTSPTADSGRTVGVRKALAGEFSCTSRFSDAAPADCAELRFAVTEGGELLRAYKPPSLRNVASRAPFMHAGQLGSLADVLQHYSNAPLAPFGHSELKPLHLSPLEQRRIIAFLGTLEGPLSAPPGYLIAPTN